MNLNGSDFRQTWLWKHAFVNPRSDYSPDEQMYFCSQYISVRERAAQLVSRIAVDMPGMTVHDIAHLDALWDMASLVAEGAISVSPAEAFIFGTSILLHDAGMSLAAYPRGLKDIAATTAWQDSIAQVALSLRDIDEEFDTEDPPAEIVRQVLPSVLRRLHAEKAEELAEQSWTLPDGTQVFLINEPDLRSFYGPTIGQIAHSHCWPVQRLEQEFADELGAFAQKTNSRIDRLKLACLLRVADALHIDSRRAPRFLRAISNPCGISALHWSFQERLARPHIELDTIVFTTGQPFGREDAEAWWLAYDTIVAIDRELRDVDLLLRSRKRELLRAKRVTGAGSPETLARTVKTKGWRPVDARVQVTDVPRVVENLGGSKLYGNDLTVALRELIQNATDAIQARRKHQKRKDNWGLIKVELTTNDNETWLAVEDNGIGMSEHVLTGPLLDFGTSFWGSQQATEEFPGLIAAGMRPIGRFGIGFFSVFMLGSDVRVYSRRYDKGQDTGNLLEFRGGVSTRPILSPQYGDPVPMDGGTRIEVRLSIPPNSAGGLLYAPFFPQKSISLSSLVGSVAPNLDVEIQAIVDGDLKAVVQCNDWLSIGEEDLLQRVNPAPDAAPSGISKQHKLMKPIMGSSGQVFGRAFIAPSRFSFGGSYGVVTISGLRSMSMSNIEGILLGEATTAARDTARPIATREALASWSTEQALLIEKHILDEECQARSAEVVLECGGNIGNLKIAQLGSEWLSSSQLADHLESETELVVSFDGDFDYDEGLDDVHPRDFRSDFETSDDILIVHEHRGHIVGDRNNSWPRSITGQPVLNGSNVAQYVRAIIDRIWGEGTEEDFDERVVGTVNNVMITRTVTIFRRA